jgi:hypothetical protein
MSATQKAEFSTWSRRDSAVVLAPRRWEPAENGRCRRTPSMQNRDAVRVRGGKNN